MPAPVRHLLLFDGECGFCTTSVQLVLERDKGGAIGFAPLQSRFAKDILARHDVEVKLDTLWLVENLGTDGERVRSRSKGALGVLAALGGRYRGAARVLGLVPKPLADRVYDVVARNRMRLAGRDRCVVPTPHQRARFFGLDET